MARRGNAILDRTVIEHNFVKFNHCLIHSSLEFWVVATRSVPVTESTKEACNQSQVVLIRNEITF